jgi:hypothetical protein
MATLSAPPLIRRATSCSFLMPPPIVTGINRFSQSCVTSSNLGPRPFGVVFIGDDFRSFNDSYAVASNVGRYASEAGGYRSYEDTGGSIVPVAADKNGTIKLTTAATDNNEVWIQPGNATNVLCDINKTTPALTIFEARVKTSAITTTTNFFVGLSEEGLAAADTVTDAGALASKDFLGFWALEADSSALKFGYRIAGQAAQTIVAAATLAADTWIKLGFVYDPNEPPSQRITAYVNNVPLSTYITKTLLEASLFPNNQGMNMLFGVKNNNANVNVSMDWWGLYQQG